MKKAGDGKKNKGAADAAAGDEGDESVLVPSGENDMRQRRDGNVPQRSPPTTRRPAGEYAARPPPAQEVRFKDQVGDRSSSVRQASPRTTQPRHPGAVAALSDGPRFKDQVGDRGGIHHASPITTPPRHPGAVASPPAGPRFKDQVGDRSGVHQTSPRTTQPRHPGVVAAPSAGPRFKDQVDDRAEPPHGPPMVSSRPGVLSVKAGPNPIEGGADAQSPSGPDVKDQARKARAVTHSPARGLSPVAEGSDRKSPPPSPGAAAVPFLGEGLRYKDQVRDVASGSRKLPARTIGVNAGMEAERQLRHDDERRVGEVGTSATHLPSPNEGSPDADEEQPAPGNERRYVSPTSVSNEQNRSTLLLQAQVVESDEAVRERILNEAVEADVFDETRARRRRIVIGLLLMGAAAAVAGAIAGTLPRTSGESTTRIVTQPGPTQSDPTLAPSNAPSLPPTSILRNDICDDARRVTFTNGAVVFENNLMASTNDADSIDCLDDSLSRHGWWYTFTGNGLTAYVELCTNSGQVRTPLVLTGRCGDLTCTSDIKSTYSINASSTGCTILDTISIPMAAETQYWMFVYTDSSSLIDDGSYRLRVSSNDVCEGALDINSPNRARFTGSTAAAQPDNILPCSDTAQSAGAWFRRDGNGVFVSLSTCDNNAFDTKISVYEGGCGRLQCVSGEYESCGEQSRVVWFAEKGVPYHILLHGSSPSSKGPFTLTATETPAYTRCERGVVLGLAVNGYFGSAFDAEYPSGSIAEVPCGIAAISQGVWYQLLGENVTVNLNVCSNSTDARARIALYSGPSCDEAICLGDVADNVCQAEDSGLRSGVTWLADEGAAYYIFVHDFEGASDFVLNLGEVAPTPAPSTSPSQEPSAIFSAAPSTSRMPVAPTASPSSQPSTSECSIEIAISCFVAEGSQNGTDCSEYQMPFLSAPLYDPSSEPFNAGSVSWEFAAEIEIPVWASLNATGREVTLQTLTVETNFAGFGDLSDQIAGIQLESGVSPEVIVTLRGTVDTSYRRNYTLYLEAEGNTTNSGEYCRGSSYNSIEIGNAPSIPNDGFETITESPTLSPVQYPNDTGPCSILTGVSSTLRFGKPPNNILCSEGSPSALWLRYTGNLCNSSDFQGRRTTCIDFETPDTVSPLHDFVVVEIEDFTNNETVFRYEPIVPSLLIPIRIPLNLFRSGGKPTETVRISVDSYGLFRSPLQVVEIGTSCENNLDDIRLLANYGRFQLIGFESPSQGQQIAMDYAEISLTVRNNGDAPLNITSISSTPSDFAVNDGGWRTGEYNWRIGDSLILPGQSHSLRWTYLVDLVTNFDPDQSYTVNVDGVNALNGLGCNSSPQLTLPY